MPVRDTSYYLFLALLRSICEPLQSKCNPYYKTFRLSKPIATQPQQQRAPPAAARVNRGTEGGGGGGGGTRGDPLVNMREHLFHRLFYQLTLTYARAVPKSVRRLLETMILIKVRSCIQTTDQVADICRRTRER